jgi:hypothetical protein
LDRKLEEQLEKNDFLKTELNHIISVLSTLIHHVDLSNIIQNIKNKIYNSEQNSDTRRKRK